MKLSARNSAITDLRVRGSLIVGGAAAV